MLARCRAGPDSVKVKSEPYRLLEKRNLERLYQMRADIRIEALAHAITPFTRVRRQSWASLSSRTVSS